MMSRLSKISDKKAKTTKVGEGVRQIIASGYLGDEPMLSTIVEPSDAEYVRAFTWYNMSCSKADARNYLDTYLKANNRGSDIQLLRKVPDCWFPDQAAWIARMYTRGAVLKDKSRETLNKRIQTALTYVPEEEKKATVSVQSHIKDKVSEFIGEFDEEIDAQGYHYLSMYTWLQKHQITPLLAKRVGAFYEPIAAEAEELLEPNCDPQLLEGYDHLTSKEKKARAVFYRGVVSDCDKHYRASKNAKVDKKPKQITKIVDKTKDMKFQKDSQEFKLASIQPSKILGAEELWTFNTRYSLLTVLYAADHTGLDVSGSSIKNYDETKSMSYKLGRKSSEKLDTILKSGKRVASKLLMEYGTCDIQKRINENTILLKVG